MKNKKCPSCGQPMKRNGKTSAGTQRWRCKSCGASATHSNDTAARELEAFLGWLLGKGSTELDMPGQGRHALSPEARRQVLEDMADAGARRRGPPRRLRRRHPPRPRRRRADRLQRRPRAVVVPRPLPRASGPGGRCCRVVAAARRRRRRRRRRVRDGGGGGMAEDEGAAVPVSTRSARSSGRRLPGRGCRRASSSTAWRRSSCASRTSARPSGGSSATCSGTPSGATSSRRGRWWTAGGSTPTRASGRPGAGSTPW